MSRIIFLFVFTLMSFHALATPKERNFFYLIEEQKGKVHIKDDPDAVAAVFNDGLENQIFLEKILMDRRSPLYLMARNLELKICGFNSLHFEWIEGCGQVTFTTPVETHLNRNNLKNSQSGYVFFLGFLEDSPEIKMRPYYLGKINETVQVYEKEEYNVLKVLELSYLKEYVE